MIKRKTETETGHRRETEIDDQDIILMSGASVT